MTEQTTQPALSPSIPCASPVATPAAKLIQSEELFSGQREVLIVHGEQLYRLRLTRANKLILHK